MIMPRLSLRSWATVLSLTLLVFVVWVEEGRVVGAQQRASTLALQASNARAERDSTRQAGARNERMARLLHDSLHLAERLVVQTEQRQDELDRALRRERIARFNVSVTADSLSASSRAGVVTRQLDGAQSVRRASFTIRQVPYTLTANVALSQAPDTAVMSAHVELDTLYLEARVGCAAPDADGIREATLAVTGPTWARLRFERVEQSPGLCASPGLMASRRRSSAPGRIPLVVGVGPVLGVRGAVSWGVFVGAGYGFWR